MAYRVKISRSAKADAEDAYEWKKEQYSEAHASRWFNGLVDAVNSLAEFPGRCPLAPESEELGIELRQLLYGKRSAAYRIVFGIVQDANSGDELVRVYCIWNSARDKIKVSDLDDG
jgi:plasmid stabilization system protein ParE